MTLGVLRTLHFTTSVGFLLHSFVRHHVKRNSCDGFIDAFITRPAPPPSSQSLVLRTSKSDFVKLCDLPNPTTYNLSKPEKNVKTCGRHWETAHLPSPFHQISCVKASCQIAHFQEMALVGSGAQLPKGRRRTNLRYFVSQFSWRKEGI